MTTHDPTAPDRQPAAPAPEQADPRPLPLAGLRVVDLTRVLAGPWCTQILADMGAEVIKIENPEGGDDTRSWGPPWLRDPQTGEETREAAYFLSANRNKKSLALDLRSEEGREIVRRLAAGADVFVENFKVGGLKKYGLDHESLRALNPGLIYVSITGFGQTGPMAAQPGYDYLIQGLGGLMSITGQPDDQPGGGPMRVGVAIADITTGLYAAIGILAALRQREATGLGQHIDMALLDTQVGWLANQAMNWFIGGKVPTRTGVWHPNLSPYQPFDAADGKVIIAVGNDRQFRALCDFIGLSWMADHPDYATNPARNANRPRMIPLIAEKIAQRPRAWWIENLPRQGVPCSGLNDIKQAFEEPQVQARGMKIETPHALGGTVPGVANPIRFSDARMRYDHAAPLLGQHSRQVLTEALGMSDAQIDALRDKGVIREASPAQTPAD